MFSENYVTYQIQYVLVSYVFREYSDRARTREEDGWPDIMSPEICPRLTQLVGSSKQISIESTRNKGLFGHEISPNKPAFDAAYFLSHLHRPNSDRQLIGLRRVTPASLGYSSIG